MPSPKMMEQRLEDAKQASQRFWHRRRHPEPAQTTPRDRSLNGKQRRRAARADRAVLKANFRAQREAERMKSERRSRAAKKAAATRAANRAESSAKKVGKKKESQS